MGLSPSSTHCRVWQFSIHLRALWPVNVNALTHWQADHAILFFTRSSAWGDQHGAINRADEVTLSRKGAKNRTHARSLRSTRTETRTHVDRVRESNAELEKKFAEALEQQAATSEILRVIRSSPSNVQPVFDTIAANAVRLRGARMGAVHLFDGKLLHIVAYHNFPPEAVEVLRRMYPRPPTG
jgi:hypothetical protein